MDASRNPYVSGGSRVDPHNCNRTCKSEFDYYYLQKLFEFITVQYNTTSSSPTIIDEYHQCPNLIPSSRSSFKTEKAVATLPPIDDEDENENMD